MKNRLVFILFFSLLFFFQQQFSFAQFSRLSYGLRGGLNLADSNTDVGTLQEAEGGDYDRRILPRFSAGGLIEYALSETFAVQLNLLYNQKGEKFIVTFVEDFVGIIDIEVTNTYDYLSVPAFFKMKFFESEAKPFIIVGPEFSYLLAANQKVDASIMVIDADTSLVNESIEDDIQSMEWAVNFGVGLEFPVSSHTGFLEARYGLGLTPFNKEGEEDYKNNIIYVNLGFIF
jgi:hypothetical protein